MLVSKYVLKEVRLDLLVHFLLLYVYFDIGLEVVFSSGI